jgi:hypothetical protein
MSSCPYLLTQLQNFRTISRKDYNYKSCILKHHGAKAASLFAPLACRRESRLVMAELTLRTVYGPTREYARDVSYRSSLTGAELAASAASALGLPANPNFAVVHDRRWLSPELPISDQSLPSGATIILMPRTKVYRPRPDSKVLDYRDIFEGQPVETAATAYPEPTDVTGIDIEKPPKPSRCCPLNICLAVVLVELIGFIVWAIAVPRGRRARLLAVINSDIGYDPFVRNGTFAVLANGSANVEKGFRAFLKEYPQCPWLLRVDRNGIVNTSNLFRYLLATSGEEIVFRAYAAGEVPVGGWLMSRAYAETHIRVSFEKLYEVTQNIDKAEAILVKQLYPHVSLWNELGIIAFPCVNCGASGKVKKCPTNVTAVEFKDVIVSKSDTTRVIRQAAGDDLVLYQDGGQKVTVICRRAKGTTMWNPVARNVAFLKRASLPDPLIDYAELKRQATG